MEEVQVAVVGIGCNFPGGEGLENFWNVLLNGTNCSVPIPKERFNAASWFDPDDNKPGKCRTDKAAFVDGFNHFDNKSFGISDSEVEQMDPQQKMLLECVFRALENAGIPMEKASGTRTGVFIGLMNRDYEIKASHAHASVINHWTGTGLAMSIAANRISYIFNLTGPSLALDCACSSSLVALHLACQSIKQGDCEMAICGGVNCIIEPRVFVALSKAKMISPDGTSKPFSSKADGYGRGEGCGVVLLKPLEKALQDGDHVWGIITKTAVNQDGHSTSPITKPSMTQQEELLRRIYSESDIANVQYIEAHGTGTPVGDPTEAGSISNVIARVRPPGSGPLLVGSVKGNIGHTESAAGVAGLIKVLLMMKHETIAPTVFYSSDSTGVQTEVLNIQVPFKAERWECLGSRLAGVNNFGFGGTNAHAIIKQHQQAKTAPKNIGMRFKYFVLSASSTKSLTQMMRQTLKDLEADVNIDALSYTSACRRSHRKHRYRRAIRTSSVADLKEKLEADLSKATNPSLSEPKLVFVFCGNGVTYQGMGKQLLAHEPVFREKIEEITELFLELDSLNVLGTLERECADLTGPDVVQPLLFAIQVGIAALLRHWGVKPGAILGHSAGEVAAAHCSGLLSLPDAVKVIHYRSQLQSTVTGGKMLVVSNMAVRDVAALLSQCSGDICIAAFNSPKSCTLSGDPDALTTIHKQLGANADLFVHLLDLPVAYHSRQMDSILPKIRDSVGDLEACTPSAQLISTVTGREAEPGDFCSGDYWARNIREPVFFEQALQSVARGKQNTIFLEIGPRKALQRYIGETLGDGTAVLGSMQPQRDHGTMTTVVSELFELGFQVDWDVFYKGHETEPLPFPKYQFETSCKDVIISASESNTGSDHPVLFSTGGDSNLFTCDLFTESCFYLSGHKHKGVPIIPGSFYAELGLAAFLTRAKPKVPLQSLRLSVDFFCPFVLTPNPPEMKVQLQPSETQTNFTVFSSSATFASGTVVSKKERQIEETFISLSSIYQRCTGVFTHQEVYDNLSQGGFDYGVVFRNKADVYYGKDLKEAVTVVTVAHELRPQLHDYCIHPVVLDYLMQLLPITVEYMFTGRPGFPSRIGSLIVLEPLQEEMIVYLRATDVGSDHFEVCGCFADKQGRVLVELKHVMVKYLGNSPHVVEEYFYHNDFGRVPAGIASEKPPRAFVFSDNVGISNDLRPHLDPKSKWLPLTRETDLTSWGPDSLNIADVENFDEVLFLWGNEDLTSMQPDVVLNNLVSCCEVFRQIVVELKEIHFPHSIRAVTYCSSDLTVDRVSPGFVIAGMTRSMAAELPELSFQLIDISSSSAQDVEALAEVLRSCPCSEYPELVIKGGEILKPSIVRTPEKVDDSGQHAVSLPDTCVFQTGDAYKVTHVSAFPADQQAEPLGKASVEIKTSKISVHSSDYFPVTASHLNFGKTLYWNEHSSQNHDMLCLDFCGTVTAVGEDVKKFKVGDRVASCYPAVAGNMVRVPEAVCYSTKRFPFLEKAPCISYFVLAWEILHRLLPQAKQHLGLMSCVADSALMKVLALALFKSGWHVSVATLDNTLSEPENHMDTLIVLPPYDESLVATVRNFPWVQHVFLICEYKTQHVPDVLQSVKDSVHVQKIDMVDILQRGSLRAQRPLIHRWLKSLNLSKKFSLESFTFQDITDLHTRESYFSSKELAVVSLENEDRSDIALLPCEQQLFRKRAVYIVVGGLSGLGFETVKFISQRGGECVVILSRSKPAPDVKDKISNIEKQCGNTITTLECDVSIAEQVHAVFASISEKHHGYPIKGVFHSAVVLNDGLIETLNRSLYEKVLKPKVNGVLNLHYATKSCQLDYFVCFSSISAFLGNASQTNYAAANTFLDLFCHYRRKLGLPGQSINWGALNLGLLLNKQYFHRFLEAKGIMVLDVAEIHKSLEQCLMLNRPQQAVCRFHFRNIRFNVLSQNAALTMRLSALVEEAFQKAKETDSRMKQTRTVSSTAFIISLLADITGMEQAELKDELLLSSLGVDSLQAMTLQNLIFQGRGVNLPLVKLLDPNATVATIVAMLREQEGSGIHGDEDEQVNFTAL
ncbi:phenolphthiocerol/phthiocerol polyketide synthase subunit C-like [Neosynchiropus ocellatus]